MTNIAFIGAGDVADIHAEAVSACAQAQLCGLWTIDEAQAAEKSERFGCRTYPSAAALLADDTIDAVFILTPLETHHEYACQALESGKHILIEKPVSTDAAQIREIRDLAAKRDLVCMPGHNYIHEPGITRIKEMLDAGKLGRIVSVYILYNIAHVEHIAARYPGVISQIMTHHSYALMYLAGPPVRLSAMKATLNYETITQENIATVNLQLADGALAHFSASFAADDHAGDPWTMMVKVIGTEGAARFSYRDWVEYRAAGAHSQVYTAYHESIRNEVDFFVNRCLGAGETPLSTMDDACRASDIVAAIERAAETGETISL